MTPERRADRHRRKMVPFRAQPSTLVKQLDEKVGEGKRSKALSVLLARFLGGRPMPTLGELAEEMDKLPQDDRA